MPTYQYRCQSCRDEFEVRQSFSDDALTTCPDQACGGTVSKVFSGVGISFKGDGFYKNDHGSASKSQRSESDGTSSDSSSSDPSTTSSDSSSSKDSKSTKDSSSPKDSSSDSSSTSSTASSPSNSTSTAAASA